MTSQWRQAILADPWAWWRSQMPITEKWAYFDHAAVGPLSLAAFETMSGFLDQASKLGDTVWPSWAARKEKLRQDTAKLLNCTPAEIGLVPNTSTGINWVAEGWAWQPGDNIVVPAGEFPSNLFPWLNQQARGVEVRVVPRRAADEVGVGDLMDAADASTRMVAASWVGYASGFRLDVAELVEAAHRRGILVFLDAIQGLGMFPLDLQKVPVDFLAADGHKWLLGPEGAGVAMIRSEHLDKIRVGNVGWGSVKNSYNYNDPKLDLRDEAARFEAGSANMVGLGGLSASLEMFLAVNECHGESAIGDRVVALATQLDGMLRQLGATTSLAVDPKHRSGIVNFSLRGVEPAQIRSRGLDEHVVLSCRGSGVRASVHAYNNEDDLQRLVAVARSFC
ncbi:Cysteine desulfurase [Novipirellula galeiformis]|uniref:Cysteine desulfurase n=1 Tax=Novipirellula galeiformis TaxID=2528004 RepID=A0A5C6C7X4_9BACT|nr:aminotransferase class V-fold PLP-dependent enzyme [Novipirellula galeiformis]TWU20117.1 Cysteine desulfurase [Novipirellula galeiformis]